MSRVAESLNPDLFTAPNARRTDPATSQAAGDHARESFASSHRAKILEVMRKACRPLAPQEIANTIGCDYHAINRRTPELERMGLIEVSPQDFYINSSGSRARRYRLRAQNGS